MITRDITITVNGRTHRASVEPRTSLADFLRESLLLTGTHLGCEQGVCGACTVNLDGAPARSCIVSVAACDGADVRTIEGFEDDAVMANLRRAFSASHALQCGYCTPGMLITSRDIVTRLPDADEHRIRVELSGNLCRCTGYMGIVEAIGGVLESRPVAVPMEAPTRAAAAPPPMPPKPTVPAARKTAVDTDPKMTRLTQSFSVGFPRDAVWALFGDFPRVVVCMPGASLTADPDGGHVIGKVAVKLGPIRAEFAGEGDINIDAAAYSGTVRGMGLDKGHNSRAKGDVIYRLTEEDGNTTRVDVDVAFALSGTLAQFSRGGIVNAVADRMTQMFVANLEAALGGADATAPRAGPQTAELEGGRFVLSVLWAWLMSPFRRP